MQLVDCERASLSEKEEKQYLPQQVLLSPISFYKLDHIIVSIGLFYFIISI